MLRYCTYNLIKLEEVRFASGFVLKRLTLKLTILLALVTAQRGKSLFLNVGSMIDSGSSIVFRCQEHVKQSTETRVH